MTTINLKYGYYIEIDPLNYTLRQKFKGQTREGQEKDSVRTCGYFGNIRSARDFHRSGRCCDRPLCRKWIDIKSSARAWEKRFRI